MEGNDRGSVPEDRPPTPALYRRAGARLSAHGAAVLTDILGRTKKGPWGPFFCVLERRDFPRNRGVVPASSLRRGPGMSASDAQPMGLRA
ncbi:hypothetical protein CHELA40_14433 [Chelatococcus asaccharovorans]|nr:hypothetical protein CHELA17_61186 [Chelatococcus asaccharovorans]CAH1677498.1 hypothetical protein CHELA40_14433 [Chelatococcus asaccharovorans]